MTNDSNIRVVILDDEEPVIRLLKALIPWDELGISFAGCARNGIDGKTLILEKKPDIVITDIKMPGLDGLQLIADIHSCLDGIDFIIVSGFSQFDYAKKAIAYNVENYLLKPINKEELRTTLEKLIAKRTGRRREVEALKESGERKKNELFLRLLSDVDFQKTLDLETEFGVLKTADACLCLLKTDSTAGEISAELYHLLADKLSDIFKKHELCLAWTVAKDIAVFLCAPPRDERGRLREKLSLLYFDAQKIAEVFPQLRFTLFYGAPADDSFAQSHAALLRMLPFRRRRDGVKMIGFEETGLPSVPDEVLDGWNKSCARMLDCLDPAAADELTAAFVKKAGALAEDVQDALFVSACRRLAVRAEECLPSQDTWFSLVALPALNLAGTTEELHGRFCAEITRLIADIAAKKKQESVRPVRLADAYMRSHFMDYDISLERVAEIVELTPAYFSALYKKETGIGFLEALTAVRIKRAKELLQGSNETVARIAAAVGYTDIKYFSRIFRKLTEITPNEYRQFYR